MKPVLFLHGLSCDMNAYFASTEENISPFLLANEGFDVWLANFRGKIKIIIYLTQFIKNT